MLQLTPQSRILLATEPVDFRKGIDGLAAVCRQVLREQPLSGAVFVFRNRAGTALKLLVYDGQGFWLCTKRLSQGRFHWWPHLEDASIRLAARELSWVVRLVLRLAPDAEPVSPPELRSAVAEAVRRGLAVYTAGAEARPGR